MSGVASIVTTLEALGNAIEPNGFLTNDICRRRHAYINKGTLLSPKFFAEGSRQQIE